MSTTIEQVVKCPCGEEFDATLWSSVNTQTDPDINERILSGQFNVVKCDNCHNYIYAERFVLYHDPAAELMGFVYPTAYGSERTKWNQKTKNDFQTAQGGLNEGERLSYAPVSLFGLDELVDVLTLEQEKKDQGDILDLLAAKLDLTVLRIKQSLAREKNIPDRLPLVKTEARGIDNLKKGLAVLLKENDRLSVYQALLDALPHRLDLNDILKD